MKHDYDRIPYLVAFQNNSRRPRRLRRVAELVVLESYLLKPKDKPSDTVLVFMHPIGGGAYLPMINALARAGHHVIYCNSRFRGTDSALLMEKVVEDLGECDQGRQEPAGLSEGGAGRLERRRLAVGVLPAAGPAPDHHREPVRRRTRPHHSSDLPAADGIMLLAAHISRHGTLTEWLDASILDESDPTKRDPELDLYNPDNPNQPPYSAEFLARYRQAQIDRNRRITAWVKDKLAELKAAGRPDDEFGFVVHGTMADPRWLDPAVDPNDRTPGTCYLGDPQVVNMSPVGLARFCTLRSWLSQWSYDDANGDGVELRPRHRGAGAGDRQPAPTTPARPATPAGCSRRSAIPTRRCTKSPAPTTITPDPDQRDSCAKPSSIVHRLAGPPRLREARTASARDDGQLLHRTPLDGDPRHRARHADRRAVRRPAARRHGRRGHQDRTARRPRPDAHLGAGRSRRTPLLLDRARAQQEVPSRSNLREPRGRDLFLDWSSTPTSSSRTSARARWRSGTWVMTCCSQRNTGIILVRVSGYGQTGPDAHKAGYASVAEAASGLRHMNGFPGGPPPRLALSLGDSLAGMFAAQGALAALYRRTVTGEGQVVDAALTESCLAVQESTIPDYDAGGVVRGPSGTRLEGIAPSNIYRSADGSWVVIAANQDTVFRAAVLGDGPPRAGHRRPLRRPTSPAAATRTSSTRSSATGPPSVSPATSSKPSAPQG